MIRVESISKCFVQPGKFLRGKTAVQAVADFSFTAADGAITGLLGPNGAGKTTSLHIMTGLLQPDAGRVSIDGRDVREHPVAVLKDLGCVGDSRGLYPRLTARENIAYYGRLHGMADEAIAVRVDQLAETLDMRGILERRTDGFSQGERMKTALARALVHDPRHLILDEPTNGLDVVATRRLREVLRHLASPQGGGKCIVFSTHIMQEVQRLCSEVVIIAGGRHVARGTVAELCELAGCADFEDAFVHLAMPEKLGEAA